MPGARVASAEQVTLRTFEREDLPVLARQANPDLRLPTGEPVNSQVALERWVEEGFGDLTPLVACVDDDADPGPVDPDVVERVGLVSVTDHGASRPEIAYFLLPEHHGEGYGTEAVSLLVEYVFEAFHFPAVEAKTFPDNEASRALLESLGFTKEGRLRDDVYWDGRYRDQVVYGLRQDEWAGD